VARRREVLERLAAELGEDAVAVPADVTRPDHVAAAVQQAVARLGGLDIVVNSAGVAAPIGLDDLDPAAWQQTIDVNLSGSFYVAREAARWMMAADGGTIVNVGSELSFRGVALYVAYCASKAGIIGLTRALAAELAPKVTVNAVCPGPIDTPMLHGEFALFPDPKGAYESTVAQVPLKRLATADEVAAAILFLAAEAPYATGSLFSLDGGITIG
jgi:NAD(P)-dependent dehydrogenase (short-subunit alcohol dehydrogenase family)